MTKTEIKKKEIHKYFCSEEYKKQSCSCQRTLDAVSVIYSFIHRSYRSTGGTKNTIRRRDVFLRMNFDGQGARGSLRHLRFRSYDVHALYGIVHGNGYVRSLINSRRPVPNQGPGHSAFPSASLTQLFRRRRGRQS